MKIKNVKCEMKNLRQKIISLNPTKPESVIFYLVFLLSFFIFNFSFLIYSYAGGAVAARQNAQKQMMQKKRAQQGQQNFQAQRATQAVTQEKMKQQQQLILEKQKEERAIIERTQQKSQVSSKQQAEQVRDVVDLQDMIASFETSSRAWPLIIDQEAKAAIVTVYIDQYRRQGTVINKSSVFYADMIDAMAQQTPDMFDQPFNQVLKILAILEYDFNNGQDKDAMALKILGSQQAVVQNKQRLGI